MINYDPDNVPDITREMVEEAENHRLQIVHVICDEPGARVGDSTGISFMTLVSSIPRPGEKIVLEDGRKCVVQTILHKVVTRRDASGKATVILLVPNVIARLSPDGEAARQG